MTPRDGDVIDTLAVWHRLLTQRDASGLDALLDDDVVFHSPVVFTSQVGKIVTTMYLTAAFHVFVNDSFRYVRQVVGVRDAVLEFVVVIDGVTVNGVDMMTWSAQGRITEFKVMLRPLKAVQLVHARMAALLAVRR